MMISLLLLVILFVFVIWPMVKGLIAINRARRSARQFFNQFRQGAGDPNGGYRRAAEEQPRPKSRKKINPDDGEFVAFEDIPGDSSSQGSRNVKVEIEQQIVDVEWEDIK